MEKQDYESLVWSLQSEAQDVPGAFRTKVLLISVLAYVVLFALLLVLVFGLYFMLSGATGGVHTLFKIFFASWVVVVAPIVWLTFRVFFTPLPAPPGRELTEAEAPQLFKMIAALRERLQAAPIHHVLITNEFNAAIAQCPRFGLFGGYRNYLILGLPLLEAVSAEELLAIVAHEYGHLAGGHGKLSRWIYRQRSTFDTLYEHARTRRDNNMVNGVLAGMLDWFAPYYNAYTFVLSRQNEYEADAMSCQIAGAEASATALIRIGLLSNWLHGSFWPKLYAQSTQHEMPPVMPYVAIRKLLMMTMDEWATRERLTEVWKVESDVYDTHPCLSERVTAMGQRAALPAMPKLCAADALLGNFAPALVREFDGKWWAEEKDKWQKYHRRYTRSKTRIADLEKQPVAALSVSDAQELALLLVEFRSVAAAKYVLEDLLGREGERYPKPVFYYGCALLEEGNASGLGYLEEAFRLSPSMGDDCSRVGYQWLCEKQSEEAAESWLGRLQAARAPVAAG
ncbi:MAG: M48 family metallopeptidase [Nitrosomonadales bacterium]|nr:M48 family metallopeptidase [Nitrosomonadales bacterium]